MLVPLPLPNNPNIMQANIPVIPPVAGIPPLAAAAVLSQAAIIFARSNGELR
jgi:hypothetical protein